MICSQYPPSYGGAGKQAQLLSAALVRRGWNVSVVTLDQDSKGSAEEDKVRVTRLLRGMAATSTFRRTVTTLGLGLGAAVIVLTRRPHAVHVHGAYWWSIPPLLAARLVRATTIVKVTRDGEDDPETVMNRRIADLIPVGWLYGLSFRLADNVVTLSTEAFDKATRRLESHSKVKLVRNGVDVAALKRTDIRRNRAREVFGVGAQTRITTFVGYLVEHKGVLDLLAAWQQRAGSAGEELWLVGPYDGYYRELTSKVLAEVVKAQEAGFNIRLFGHVEASQMPSIYWATDVFTLPSYAEGMPNSLAEAMVAGCAVVATDIPGITDIVKPGYGDLVSPGDVQALARALDRAQDVQSDGNAADMDLGIERIAEILEGIYDAPR